MNTISRNFLTTLKRFKLASALNVIGLSVAFAAFLIIIMQVNFERTFDEHYKDSSRIYRINGGFSGFEAVIVPRPVLDVYQGLSSTVEQITLIEPEWGGRPSYYKIKKGGDYVGYNEPTLMASETFPEFFSLEFVEGSAKGFSEPNSIIIPQSVAKKIFGEASALDQQLFLGSENSPVNVVGVFKDIPENSQIKNAVYHSFPKNRGLNMWEQSNYVVYIKLFEGSNSATTQADFDKFRLADVSQSLKHISLIPLEEIYFTDIAYYGDEILVKKGNRETTAMLFAIAVLIIMIAGINFVNFSTSLAPLRMKSINTQKVLGSPTSVLRGALVVEAVGISVISFFWALLWIYLLSASQWQNITMSGIRFAANEQLILLTGVIAVLVGLIAGIYPAYYTTKFPPALVLKGSFAMTKKGRSLRISLVGFQFVISIGLIIGSMFLQLQNQYLRTIDKGFNSSQIAVISLGGELLKNSKSLESKLKESATIEDVAYSQFRIGKDNIAQGWGREFKHVGEQMFSAIIVSWNFPQVMGLELIEGEFMKESDVLIKERGMSLLFNETAKKQFQIAATEKLDIEDSTYTVIQAIVKDFNFKSLHMDISPCCLAINSSDPHWMPFVFVKITGDPYQAIEYIKKTIKEIDPVYPAEVEFFDAAFEQMYQQDLKTTKLITLFSILAIIISFVGVFGLIVFETQYKRKEIGVRKIMGSTVMEILVMLNRKFFWIVIICFAIAVPLAYFGVDAWLGGFAYRTPMYWWVFALGGLIVFIITVTTVTVQSYRSATENPVNSLKSE